MDDQRPGGQPSQRVGSRLAGAAAQFFRTHNEQRSLLHLSALPLGGESEIDAQERHPVRVEKGSMPQSTTHRVDRPGQVEPVSHAHPVERPVDGAFGGVAVQMAVYVKQGRRAFPSRPASPPHRPTRRCSCPRARARHRRHVTPTSAACVTGTGFRHRRHILRAGIDSIRPPDLLRQISCIDDFSSSRDQRRDQPGIAQRARRAVLAGRVTGCTARVSDHRQR